MRFVATKRGRPIAVVEALSWDAARKCQAPEIAAADSINAVAAFEDHGLNLREGFKQRALQQGHDEATAERIAEASGFRSALQGLPEFTVEAGDNGVTGMGASVGPSSAPSPHKVPAAGSSYAPYPKAHVVDVALNEPAKKGSAK